MKVLFITNVPSPYRVEFFNKLGDLCDLTVVYERKAASDRDSKWNADSKNNYNVNFLNGIKIGADNSFSLDILRLLKSERFDRIIIGMYSTYTAILTINYLKRNGIPFGISTDGGFIKKERKIKYLIKKKLISSASYWFITGQSALNYFSYYGADVNKCYLYPFSSVLQKDVLKHPISKQEKILIRKKIGLPSKYIVLSVGQFIYRKGYDVLLKAIPQLDFDAEVYIVGGKINDEYQKICEEYQITNVHFLDFMKKDDLVNYYKAADLFVLPTREDIWGLVINEAISNCLPVVTSYKCLAGAEIIKPGMGCVIENEEDEKSYAEAINKIYHKEIEINYDDICLAGEKYTIENMAETVFRTLGNM